MSGRSRERWSVRSQNLAYFRERCATTPLDDGVHEFDLERLNIIVFYDWQFRFLRDLGYSPRNLLHHSQRGSQFFLQLRDLLTLGRHDQPVQVSKPYAIDSPSL